MAEKRDRPTDARDVSRTNRRWCQFSLRALLLFGLACCVPCSWIAVGKRTGWPRAVSRPGLPQTRTCAINAFGSSGTWFRPIYPLLCRSCVVRSSMSSTHIPTTSPCSRCLPSLPGVRAGGGSPASKVL